MSKISENESPLPQDRVINNGSKKGSGPKNVQVAVGDVNGDGQAEKILGSSEYLNKNKISDSESPRPTDRGFLKNKLVLAAAGLVLVAATVYIAGTSGGVWRSGITSVAVDPSDPSGNISAKPAAYAFKKLGINMEVLPGWKVQSSTTKEGDANFYTWTVEKEGADGKIVVSSTGFRGGFEACEGPGSLTAEPVTHAAPTKNSDLTFLAWYYMSGNETYYSIGVVKSDEAIFKTTNDSRSAAIKNRDLKNGNYFFCLSEPLPGFSLGLNEEKAPGFTRQDTIKALSSDSTAAKNVPLLPTAKSYAEIKTMLTSIARDIGADE